MGRVDDILKRMNGGGSEEDTQKSESRVDRIINTMKTSSYTPDSSILNSFATDYDSFVKKASSDYNSVYMSEEYKQSTIGLRQRINDIMVQYNLNRSVLSDEEVKLKNYLTQAKSNLEQMGNDINDSSKGLEGYQKYLDDEEAKKNGAKYDLNKDGKDSWWEKVLGYLGGGGGVDTTLPTAGVTQTIHDLREDDSYARPNNDWTTTQKAKFGALYLESPEKAYAYASATNQENNRLKEEKEIAKIKENATESFGSGFVNTLGAIATAPLGLADYLQDLTYAAVGKEISPDGNISPFEYSQAVTGGISEHLNEKGGTLPDDWWVIGGKGWGDVYGLGTSIAQSMASAYTLGAAGTLVSYFGQGAAAGVDDALARGATNDQAILYGAALGTFEGVAEMIGIDNLFKLGSASTVKGLIKNILKQAGAEGAEEGLTSILSNIADNAIMQDKSNFAYRVAEYMAQGMSEAEAKRKAWMSAVGDIAFDTIAGAVSGSVSGSIHTAVQTVGDNINAKKIYGENAQDLVTEALEIDSQNAYAQQMQERLDNGKSLSGGQINRLVEANEDALVSQDKGKMKTAVEARLTELGESGDVSKLADVIVKAQTGEKLTSSESSTLVNSKFGRRVSTELNPESIESGEYTSKWAENIGTERINTEAYNRSVTEVDEERKTSAGLETENKSTISRAAVEEKLKSLGETRDVSKVAEIVTKKLSGKEITSTEAKILEVSDHGKEVLESSELKVADAKNATPTEIEVTIEQEGTTTEAKVESIESITEEGVTLKLKDGATVDSSEVNFKNSEIGLVYQAATDMSSRVGGFNVDTANTFVKGYNPSLGVTAAEYVHGWSDAYRYGKMGYPVSELERGVYTSKLSGEQRNTAYNFGRAFGNEEVSRNQAAVSKTETTTSKKKGRVIFDGEKYGKSLNERQRASLKGLGVVAEAMGIDIHVFESEVVDGKRQGANGWYDPVNKEIHIDLYAGVNGDSLMLFTASHELTHHIREVAPAKFKAFADALLEEYTKHGVSLDELIATKIEQLERNNRITPNMTEEQIHDLAYEEVVADSAEAMLTDSNAIEALSRQLQAKDKGLWETIKDFFTKLVARIKAAYEGLSPDSAEGKFVREMEISAEKLQRLWVDALLEASEVSKGATVSEGNDALYSHRGTNKDGIEVYETSEEIKNLPIKERQKVFLDIMKNEYRGRTAKFIRNGHAYYASFDYRDINKNIYGDKLSDKKGWKAKINVGAEGEIFELVENAKYSGSKPESGKNISAHSGVEYWDYFIKNVQIDGTVFDLIANVRKKSDGQFVYSIQLNKNKKIEASPSLGSPNGVLNRMLNASDNIIAQDTEIVNRKFSDRDSNGNTLTKEQQEFFKDSKARDENGNLLVVYHGTRKADFTEFKRNVNFFTDSSEMAESYAPNGEKYTGYLNIRNPFVIDAKGERWSRIAIDDDTKKLLDNYGSSTFKEGGKWRTTPADIAAAIEEGIEEGEFDYDGIIIKNVDDTGSYAKTSKKLVANDYITFSSNQFKNTDNKTPTSNPDIRYSDREVSSISDADYKNVEKHFGTTNNYEVAGYMLKNGKMLDFSGKHWGDDYSTSRQVDHRDIQEVLDGRGNNGVDAMIDMISDGNIRLMPEAGGINLAVMPNASQINQLRGYINHFRGEVVIDIDAVGGDTVHSWEYNRGTSSAKILSDIKNYFETGVIPQQQSSLNQFRYSDREKSSYAPTFYSHMGKVIDDIKLEKMGSDSLLNHLKNRGVKAEEIKWSGIETFLEGKKSVTKAELQEFVAGSQLEIVEEGEDRWEQYTLDGGTNYRELVFKLPNSTYSNQAMRAHWGQDAEGILVHARIQDFDVNGKKMLFVEELQSDWHNEGAKDGYVDGKEEARIESLKAKADEALIAVEDYSVAATGMAGEWEVIEKTPRGVKLLREYREAQATYDNAMNDFVKKIPDAPFRDTYHEYVLKRLLRMAAEEGYDSIGWTTADIQSKRWSDEYAEGYRIEYDQDIPKFLRKYGKKWGATVGKTLLEDAFGSTVYTDKSSGMMYSAEDLPLKAREIVAKRLGLSVEDTDPNVEVSITGAVYVDAKNDTHIAMEAKRSHGTILWSMDITDSMKESVLYEGQVLYSDRRAEVKGLRAELEKESIDSASVISIADSYLSSYGGEMNKSEMHYDFLHAIKTMAKGTQEAYENASDEIAVIAAELAYNPKDLGSMANDLKEMKSHIRGIKFKVHEQDKGEFDIYGGFGNFRKKHMGKLTLANDGISVDSVYMELQGLYGTSYFPDVNTVAEQLMVIAEVVDTPLSSVAEYDYDPEDASAYVAEEIFKKFDKLIISGFEKAKAQVAKEAYINYRNPDSYSNRSLLAGALESAVQNDIEREKLRQYKSKIDLINSEEQKLHDLREQIKELSFKKGPRDTEAIRKLQFEANQAANRINTYDKQLLNLESTKALRGVLEREKALARKRDAQKYKEAIDRYREKSAKTQRELMDRYQESRKRGVEGRNKTAMRHKIKDVVNELNNYLLKGTKDKHVPIELQKAVAEALDAVNMDTVGAEERIAKLKAEMMRAKTPEAVQEIAKKIEHIEEMGGNMAKKIARLKTAYDSIINSDDPLVANSHDEVISNTIQRVGEIVGETPLRDMSLHQLEEVYDMYNMVLFTIRNANKAFKAKKSEEISVIANRVMEEIDKLGKKKALQTKTGEAISTFDWNNQKPVYAFERIGSDSLNEVFNNVRAGEDVWAVDMTEAQDFLEEQKNKHKYDSFDFDKKYDFTSSTGKNFSLSLGQIMSLYAYSKRGEQAKDHLKNGGFVFDGLTEVKEKGKLGVTQTYRLKDSTAYNLSDEILANIISKLTPEQKAFADEMQEYLSSTMGEKGNEVSLQLYGVKLFKEKNYFPLKSAPQFLERAREQAQGETKIKNKGFTKETTPKARNPIVLTSFMDVWAGHVNEMSMYHAFTLALEDFYRVYNYKTPASETLDSESVISFLENAHGNASVAYIDQLLKDLNGGARSDAREAGFKSLVSKFKKASVIASVSVVIQQPSAIIRAQALVDAKYFVGKKVSKGKHKELWTEVKKYAPVAVIKEMGYFDVGMGQSSVEWLKGDKTFMDKVDDKLSKAPALADELTWVAIWNAVKRETAHNNPTLKTSSEEFLKLAGERFTEVIVKTQVYDSTLARSANMRSKSAFMSMLTSFMAEPTTSLNMLQDAFKKGNKKYIARTIGAVYGSVVLNSALVSLVYAMRDDDDDETFLEKYMSVLVTELIDGANPLTYIPFAKDIWSVLQGYDVERADMALITKLSDSVQELIKVLSKDTSDMDEDELSEHNKAISEAILAITDNLSSLTGLPVKNIRRDIKGIINGFNTIKADIEGRETTSGSLKDNILEDVKDSLPIVGWLPDESKGDKLYDAIINGDTAYVERLKSGYKSETSYNSAIRKALRENDPRIKEAALARYNGDIAEYMKIAKSIIAEGHFKQDDIVAAINTEVNALKPDEGGSTPSDKAVSLYKVEDYYTALEGGNSSVANTVKEDIIATEVANGKDRGEAETSFYSKFVSHIRGLYDEGEITDYKAKDMLVRYGDKTADEAASKVQYWSFKKQYPDYDLSESAVSKYYSDVKPSGISVDVYYDYSKQRSKAEGEDLNGDGKTDSGSVKRAVLQIINSLPISSYQKDTLYYLNGWAQSTLHEAPWH